MIILAREIDADLIIIDDYQARKHANYLGLKLTGTLGILLKSKEKHYIKSVKPSMDNMIKNNIYIGDGLYQKILNLSGE